VTGLEAEQIGMEPQEVEMFPGYDFQVEVQE